jgi:hypothetical protein
MSKRKCTCGAEADVRRQTRRAADGQEEIIYRVVCPVCGQSGPAVALDGRSEETAIAEAVLAWNNMHAELRSA